MVLSIAIAVLVPLIFLYVVWVLEIFAISQIRTQTSLVAWIRQHG